MRSLQNRPVARSRQLFIKDDIRDIFGRMLIMFHPEIAPKRPRPTCSICGKIGHTARSSNHSKSSALNEEDGSIESMYY